MQEHPIPAVRGIILNEQGNVLIVRRANSENACGKWCLPGGKIDFGQRAEDAIAREIEEETTLLCKTVDFLFYLNGLPTPEMNTHYPTLFFLCKVDGDIILNNESDKYTWINITTMNKYEIVFENDEAIKKYFKEKS